MATTTPAEVTSPTPAVRAPTAEQPVSPAAAPPARRRPGQLADPLYRQQQVAAAQRAEDADRAEAAAWAREHNLPERSTSPDGVTYELYKIENGRPLYRKTHNANSAISENVPPLREAAVNGATGAGLTVGVWDAGKVRASHQEFTSGGGSRVTFGDAGSTANYHSTHVGGTIGASGVNAAAKGMAPAVSIKSYDWTSDVAEMIAAAAATPNDATKILISNHSYGYGRGWEIPGNTWYWYGPSAADREDPAFGAYNSNAQAWDAICYDAPYYLPFVSAGNDRSDGPSTGNTVFLPKTQGGFKSASYNPAIHPLTEAALQYDTLADYAVAKNVMTIGSVADAVANGVRSLPAATSSYFSSYGGADDGRIKPDLVANGESLYSTDDSNNTAYATLSGTSMASPSAAGCAVLLQHLHKQKNHGNAMRASCLKALMLHTADDLGRPGPDYAFGWGLVNAKTAADVIVQQNTTPASNSLVDDTLTNGTTKQYHFQSDGGQRLRFTIAWTDIEGASHEDLDNRAHALVNDLDLRVQTPSGATLMPFKLDVLNPTTAAVQADNSIDPIEQVFIPLAETGDYTVTVSHKGTLQSGAQVFSLVATGQVNGVQEPQPPPWVQFFNTANSPFDLANTELTFVPSNGSYAVLKRSANALPNAVSPAFLVSSISPANGNKDDGYWTINPPWTQASFFGSTPGAVYLETNGVVGLGSGTSSVITDAAIFFASRQIALLSRDLDLRTSGAVYYEFRSGDRLVVTYQNVPSFGSGGSNTVQLEIFDDGSNIIRLTYLGMSASDGIAGFSPGTGVPANLGSGADLSISPAPPVLSLSAPVAEAEEGVTALQIQASLSHAVPFPISLPLARSGAATAADFTTPLDSLTVAAYATSQTTPWIPIDDGLHEGDEPATLTAGAGLTYDLGINTVVNVGVIDHDYRGGLRALWPMDETSEADPVVQDDVGTFDGTRLGTTRIEGRHGRALAFDGSDDAVSIPAMNLNTNRISVAGWVRLDGPVNEVAGLWMTRAGASPGVGLHIAADHSLRYHWADSPGGNTQDWNSAIIVPQGRWVFVALAIEPTQATVMMRDGDSVTWQSHSATHNPEEIDGVSYLGWDPADATRRLNGALDDWHIQKRTMSLGDFDQWFIDSVNPWERYGIEQGLPIEDAGPTADPDGDGIPNLIEFSLHLAPNAFDPSPLTVTQMADGTMRFNYPSSLEASVILGLEWSDNLADWQSEGLELTPDGWMITDDPPSAFVRIKGSP